MKRYLFQNMNARLFKEALDRRDPVILNDMISFLEDDPFAFRTGYKKQHFWRYVRRFDLTDYQVQRLENAAFKYLSRRPSRVFRVMCVTMARFATDGFWKSVYKRINSSSKLTRLSSACLYAYSQGEQAGEVNRQMMRQVDWYMVRDYSGKLDKNLKDANDLFKVITQRSIWYDTKVVSVDPDPTHLPIITPIHLELDRAFASLAVRNCDRRIIINLLSAILGTAYLVIFKDTAWLYALYLLYRLDDERAVDIVTRFLERYEFFGLQAEYEDKIMLASFRILRNYGTPAALETLERYGDVEQNLRANSRNHGKGWLG